MLKITRLSDLAPKHLGTNEVVGDGGKTNDKNPSKKSKKAKSRI